MQRSYKAVRYNAGIKVESFVPKYAGAAVLPSGIFVVNNAGSAGGRDAKSKGSVSGNGGLAAFSRDGMDAYPNEIPRVKRETKRLKYLEIKKFGPLKPNNALDISIQKKAS